MKTNFLNFIGALMMLVFVTSCSKKDSDISPTQNAIVGKWATVSTSGTIVAKTGQSQDASSLNDNTVYDIKADGTYSSTASDGNIIGTYSLSGDQIKFAYTDNDSKKTVVFYYKFAVSDKSLTLKLDKSLLTKSANESTDTTGKDLLAAISDINLTINYAKQ